MKRIWLLLIILLFPVFVFAKDTCDSSNIMIKSITLEDSRGNIEEINDPSISGQKINLDLKMNVIGDSAEYKIVLKNESNEDYYFDDKSIYLDSNYVSYEVSYEDGSKIIKSGEEKEILLKVTYIEKVSARNLNNGIYNDTQTILLDLINKNTIDNPLTGRYLGLIIFICMLVGLILLFKEKKKSSYLFLIVGLILPFTVKALCKHSLEVKTNLVIDGKEAIFLPGSEVNAKMKLLSGTSSSITEYNVLDNNITSIQYSETEPTDSNKEEKNLVSTADSSYPIYMWFDNGTIYWWSEDKTPSLNKESGYMFFKLLNLESIAGIESFDASNVESIALIFGRSNIIDIEPLRKYNVSNIKDASYAFARSSINDLTALKDWDTSNFDDITDMFYMTEITNADALKNWNTANIKKMGYLFYRCEKLVDVKGIKNWNTSKVENLEGVFDSCLNLEEIDLSNWETSNATNMRSLFGMWTSERDPTTEGILKRIILSDKFNTSKVTTFHGFLANNTMIEDYSFLKYLDTSNSKSMYTMFQNNNNFKDTDMKYIKHFNTSKVTNMDYMFFRTNITNTDGLKDWDISKVETLRHMFSHINTLTNIDLSSWNTSNVTNMTSMFSGDVNLLSIDLSNFDTSKVTNMEYMFNGLSKLEELDISSFDTRNVTDFTKMFEKSRKLKHIYVGENWDTSANTGEVEYVFPSTCQLPNFDSNNSDRQNLSYAHTGDGGYLTLKTN